MTNIESLFLFTFIFTSLTILKVVFRFTRALLQDPPQPFMISNRELVFLGLSVSYFLTYLIQL